MSEESALFNVDLEADLLGQLLYDNELVEIIADQLAGDDFAMPHHARIYDLIVAQVASGNEANPVTLRGFFDDEDATTFGGAKYLAELFGRFSTANAGKMAQTLKTMARRRKMQAGLTTAAGACQDFNVPVAEIVDLVDAAISEQHAQPILHLSGAECIDELTRLHTASHRGVTADISGIDDTLGPILPKQLVVLAARPGMGKTAVALSYSLRAAQRGHGVLCISLEMSSAELAARMVSDLCFDQDVDLPFNCVRDGALNRTQREWVGRARDFAASMPFTVIDTGSLTMGRLEAIVRKHARRMEAQGSKLELVVLDYLQLIRPEGRSKSKYEHISDVSMGLKALAKDQGVGVMALAQLSRSVEQREDKRPQLSDLRDSGQIEQDADAVMFLLRDEYYLQQQKVEAHDNRYDDWQVALANARDKIEFIVAKRRNGTTGKAMGAFYGAYQAVRGLS